MGQRADATPLEHPLPGRESTAVDYSTTMRPSSTERRAGMTTASSASTATLDRSTFLRRVLYVDAATCVATGALMTLDAALLSTLLGLPAALLLGSGLSLFPI